MTAPPMAGLARHSVEHRRRVPDGRAVLALELCGGPGRVGVEQDGELAPRRAVADAERCVKAHKGSKLTMGNTQ